MLPLLMNKITHYIWIVAIAFFCNSAIAHNPNSASVTIRPLKGIWVVEYSFAQVGVNYVLNDIYTEDAIAKMTPDAYKELFVAYIKKHTKITIDGKDIPLTSGGIKLGSHQTDMKFLSADFPKEYQKVRVEISALKENKEQHTSLRFMEGEKYIRKVLSHKKGFVMDFENSPIQGYIGVHEPETEQEEHHHHSHWLRNTLIGVAAAALLFLLYYFIKKKK